MIFRCVVLEKEDFERAIGSAEKQSSYFRIEQVALRSALEELRKMRDGREVDEALYDELYQRYSQRLTDINEKAEQYRRITQSIRHITKYEKDLDVLKESQRELVQKLEKISGRLEEERKNVLEMAERFGVIVGPMEKPTPTVPTEAPRFVEERPPVAAPPPGEVSEAESEIARLKKEIMAELERFKAQGK